MRLAGVSADNPIKAPGWRVKRPDVATPDHVGAADDAEALKLEGAIEQSATRKDAQHEVAHGRPASSRSTRSSSATRSRSCLILTCCGSVSVLGYRVSIARMVPRSIAIRRLASRIWTDVLTVAPPSRAARAPRRALRRASPQPVRARAS